MVGADASAGATPRAIESCRRKVGPLLEDAPETLIQNAVRPACSHDARVGDADQKVADWCGVKDARVVDDDERHRLCLVPEAVPLRFGGEFLHDVPPLLLVLPFVLGKVREEDAAVLAHLPELELP